eukprot:TRINITY_DN24018_c0_g1_i1.p1 TRINITY_DN24018_c0_g1~~TRINITY_DN24018_c0_g1_i1.p1  ORF type:complete len:588 (-),score=87.41 TRINITY_DN24018_c0_g1_i1:236-1999(-)
MPQLSSAFDRQISTGYERFASARTRRCSVDVDPQPKSKGQRGQRNRPKQTPRLCVFSDLPLPEPPPTRLADRAEKRSGLPSVSAPSESVCSQTTPLASPTPRSPLNDYGAAEFYKKCPWEEDEEESSEEGKESSDEDPNGAIKDCSRAELRRKVGISRTRVRASPFPKRATGPLGELSVATNNEEHVLHSRIIHTRRLRHRLDCWEKRFEQAEQARRAAAAEEDPFDEDAESTSGKGKKKLRGFFEVDLTAIAIKKGARAAARRTSETDQGAKQEATKITEEDKELSYIVKSCTSQRNDWVASSLTNPNGRWQTAFGNNANQSVVIEILGNAVSVMAIQLFLLDPSSSPKRVNVLCSTQSAHGPWKEEWEFFIDRKSAVSSLEHVGKNHEGQLGAPFISRFPATEETTTSTAAQWWKLNILTNWGSDASISIGGPLKFYCHRKKRDDEGNRRCSKISFMKSYSLHEKMDKSAETIAHEELSEKFNMPLVFIREQWIEFKGLDTEYRGLLSREDFSTYLYRVVSAANKKVQVTNARINKLWAQADKDGTGDCNFEEFILVLNEVRQDAERSKISFVEALFPDMSRQVS